ncbi:MAG: TMEM43 family protein [Candidatus Coprovivens sp.]
MKKLSIWKIIITIIIICITVTGIMNINKENNNNKKILNEVILVNDGKIREENENKLVLVTGKINYYGTINFKELNHTFNTFKVIRTVQDFDEVTSAGGTISKKWVDRELTDEEKQKNEKYKEEVDKNKDYLHTILSETKTLDTTVGEYKIDEIGMNKIEADELYIDKEAKIGNLEFDGLYYSDLSHKENPELGDMRITYHYYNVDKESYITILAVQKEGSFIPYKLDSKTEIYNVYNGQIDDLDKLEKELGKTTKINNKIKILFIIFIIVVGIFFITDAKKNKEFIKNRTQ